MNYTEDCKKISDGRYRLRESFSVSKDTIVETIALKELTEKVDNVDLPIYGSYLVKIWAKDSKNKNKRNYSKVFNKVLAENKVTVGFIDHPKNDGDESYKDVVLVSKNPRMIFDEKTQEEWLAVEVTLVGKPYGENCEAVLQAGGFLEFSSSALGDVDSQGYVLEDGFFLERFCDIVVNSSNGQLFFSNKEEPKPVPSVQNQTLYDVKESVITETNNDIENLTILDKTADEISVNTGEKTMSDKIHEKALELNIKSLIKDAEKESNLFERKKQLIDAREYAVSLPEATLVEQIDKSIADTDNSISELAEKGKDVGVLTENIKTLTEQKQVLETEVSTLKSDMTKLQENYDAIIKLYEDKQFEASNTELSANKKLNELVESLQKDLTATKNLLKEASEKRDYFEAMSNSKVEADDYVALKEKVKELSIENSTLKEKNVSLLENLRSLRRNIISERSIEKPKRFETKEEQDQYDEIIKEDLKETVEVKEVRKDNLVDKILSQKGYI